MGIKISGANETAKWLGRLTGEISEAIDRAVSSNEALDGMQQAARQIVDTVVYAVYDPKYYRRTFALLESIGAVKLESSQPSAGICLNVTPDTAANNGAGDLNYAVFMLPEYADKSWLRRTVPETLPRDFLTAWHQFFADQIPSAVSAEISKVLQ